MNRRRPSSGPRTEVSGRKRVELEDRQRVRDLERLLGEVLDRGWVPLDHRQRFRRYLDAAGAEGIASEGGLAEQAANPHVRKDVPTDAPSASAEPSPTGGGAETMKGFLRRPLRWTLDPEAEDGRGYVAEERDVHCARCPNVVPVAPGDPIEVMNGWQFSIDDGWTCPQH